MAVASLAVLADHKRQYTAPLNHAQWRAVEAAQRLVESLIYHSPRRHQFCRIRPSPWREGVEVWVAYDPYDRTTW